MRNTVYLGLYLYSIFTTSSVLAYKRGCGAGCVEDFKYLMELTGWSKDTLFAVFFSLVFIILVGSVLLINKLRKKRRRS